MIRRLKESKILQNIEALILGRALEEFQIKPS